MPDDDGPQPQRGRPKNQTGDKEPEWLEHIRRRVDGLKNVSKTARAQVAAKAKISERTFDRILDDARKPTPTEMVGLCEALDLPILYMLSLIDVVPGITHLLDYVAQLEELASRTQLSSTLVDVDQIHGATVIANKVVTTGRYRVAIKPLWQGTEWRRRHYADLVAFDPIDPIDPDTMRSELRELLRPERGWYHAGEIGFPQEDEDLPTTDPRATINVPRFLAIRKRSAGTDGPVVRREMDQEAGGSIRMPSSICVVGGPWSGSADVACFLGHAFDYDYTHVGFTASRAYSRLTDEWHHKKFRHDRLEVARAFFYGSHLGRPRVWATDGDPDTTKLVGGAKNSSVPTIVYLRISDRLVKWVARTRANNAHTDLSYDDDLKMIQTERRTADDIIKGIARRAITLDVDLPAGPNFEDPNEDGKDAFFDLWADLSVEALTRLKTQLALPFDLDTAQQRLRDGGRS